MRSGWVLLLLVGAGLAQASAADAQSAQTICLADPDLALDARLAADTGYSLIDEGSATAEPASGSNPLRPSTLRPVTVRPTTVRPTTTRPMTGSTRPAATGGMILAHSRQSLLQGIARYPGNMAVFISFIAADGSCGWIVDRSGVTGYARSETDSARIATLSSAVLGSLDLEGRAAARTPVSREPEDDGGMPLARPAAIDPNAASEAARQLSLAILPPALRTALNGVDQLLIIPDNQMASFPFAMLPFGGADDGDITILDRFTIQIAPSLIEVGIGRGLHRNLHDQFSTMTAQSREELLRSSLVIGDPAYDDHEYLMPRLAGAEREAKSTAEILSSTVLLGEQATLSRFRDHVLRHNPAYLHLATHGIADQERISGNRSFVALANGDRLDSQVLDALRFRDGSVVVLSACQTGLGKEIDVGVFGLPRMLQLRGAQTVVMSLWNVDDQATAFLMTSFVKHFKESGRPASSLSQAMRETKARFPDPAKWASFSVFSVAPF